MSQQSIIQKVLGEQWSVLPETLKMHHQPKDNTDIGRLSIDYPGWMQMFLNVLSYMGALLNRKGNEIPARVTKSVQDDSQNWKRVLTFDDGKQVLFKSRWQLIDQNKIVEYVNAMFGLCMSVSVQDNKLVYSGEYFILRLGMLHIRIPEWLLLGHTTIIEEEVDNQHFMMDFRLRHPLFGQIYRYSGKFTTVTGRASAKNT